MEQTILPRGVKTLARQIRSDLLRYSGDVYGECFQFSKRLVASLAERGIAATIVRGHFCTDRRHCTTNEDGLVYTREPLHHWVEIDGVLIDGTATQFNEAMDSTLPPLVIGYVSDCWRWVPEQEGRPKTKGKE